MRQFLILAALLLVPFALSAADSTDASLLRSGDRIRFWFGKTDVPDHGILSSIGKDSIVVKNETVRAFWIEDISDLHRSTGKKGHPLTGLAIGHPLTGLAIGCGAGLIIAFAAASSIDYSGDFGPSGSDIQRGIIVGVGTFAGCAIFGTAIGAAWETERWEPVRPWPPTR
jgi:hypothetical protein